VSDVNDAILHVDNAVLGQKTLDFRNPIQMLHFRNLIEDTQVYTLCTSVCDVNRHGPEH
jgi:hypothetical protein